MDTESSVGMSQSTWRFCALVIVIGLVVNGGCSRGISGQEILQGTLGISSSDDDTLTLVTIDTGRTGDGVVDDVFLILDPADALGELSGLGTLQSVDGERLDVTLENAEEVTFVVAASTQREDEGRSASERVIHVSGIIHFRAQTRMTSHDEVAAFFFRRSLEEWDQYPRR